MNPRLITVIVIAYLVIGYTLSVKYYATVKDRECVVSIAIFLCVLWPVVLIYVLIVSPHVIARELHKRKSKK